MVMAISTVSIVGGCRRDQLAYIPNECDGRRFGDAPLGGGLFLLPNPSYALPRRRWK